jgi:DNA invertase Pin-like site-specific DNA recombinase
MARVAIYARVSTTDKGQDPENQLMQLRDWCARAGHELIEAYVEHESGRKGENGRRAFAQLFQDAARRRFDLVLFWSLDRFSREGMAQAVPYLQRLQAHGMAFHSFRPDQSIRVGLRETLSSSWAWWARSHSQLPRLACSSAKSTAARASRSKRGRGAAVA